jgi:ribose 5-phosphate isomerase A
MHAQAHKEAIAQYTASFLLKHAQGQLLGIGTGSTVNCLIHALAPHHDQFLGALSSSEASTDLLKASGFKVFDLEEAQAQNLLSSCQYYIDGADEVNPDGEMIKGGGGALTREKIVAQFAEDFICMADHSKEVAMLGVFPLPIEVLPSALTLVKKNLQLALPNAQITLRSRNGSTFVTDNQAYILDVAGLQIINPLELEQYLKSFTGIIEVGIFAKKKASRLITTKSNLNQAAHTGVAMPMIEIVDKVYAPADC